MPYDESVAERVRHAFDDTDPIVEKKMFGGIAFLLAGHICCGVLRDELMARVGPQHYEAALELPHTRPMDFTGKPLKGFVYVEPPGFASPAELRMWVRRCADFCRSLPPK